MSSVYAIVDILWDVGLLPDKKYVTNAILGVTYMNIHIIFAPYMVKSPHLDQ